MIIYPKNRKTFIKLLKFSKEISSILNKIGIFPILYGSLAYFVYIKDKKISVHDIDFYIPEKSFKKIVAELTKKQIKFNYSEKWHTLQIFKGKLKIELDSMDYWYKGSKEFKNLIVNGIKFKALSLENLMKIYKHASEVSDSPEKNLKKYISLNNIINNSKL